MNYDKTKTTLILLIATIFVVSKICAIEVDDGEQDEVQQPWVPEDAEINAKEEIQNEVVNLRMQEALENLKEILGIRGKLKDENLQEIPPQFMMELYNTVVDSDGKTQRNNPYNAKVVRSFVEKDKSSSHFYAFNLAGLEQNESVLEAELHLYKKRSTAQSIHPSIYSSPYYLIKVYQVLPNRSLEEPDLHRLLNVHYVGAYDSGWQIFNVKQAVLSWITGSKNLGLLVSTTTIFGEPVPADFSRRNDVHRDKQPILVLFNDVNDENANTFLNEQVWEEDDVYDENPELENEDELLETDAPHREKARRKRHEDLGSYGSGQLEEAPDYTGSRQSPYFHREKKAKRPRDENEIVVPTHAQGFVSRRKSLEQTLTSMDVYQRAILREQLGSRKSVQRKARNISAWPMFQPLRRPRRSASTDCRKTETQACSKRELYVNFRDIGLTTIIAPESYAAYQCQGHCKSPLSQDQKPTNHATIQGIMHKLNLVPNQDVEMPSCVPVNLSSISILYRDEERDAVVLKQYADMVVVNCGCR